MCQHLGALPQTPASLAAPQGQAVKTQPPDPVAKCWVGSKASRVKCTASPPLTPLHLRESSKTIRSGRSWKPVKACEARGRFRKRNLKHAKECSIQQRRGFACGVCRWKRRFGCSRNSAVSAARFESGFRERDGQGQHWRGPHSHGGFLKMIVCESGGHANGLTYFIFRFLRRPQLAQRHLN